MKSGFKGIVGSTPFSVGLLVLLMAAARAGAGTRLALIEPVARVHAQAAMAIVRADLGSDRDIQLVERQEIDRVIAEQKLSLSGMVDAGTAIKAGGLLSADMLAVCDSDDGSNDAGVVIFDARSGIRLWDSAVSLANPADAAKAIAGAVRAAIRKRSLPQSVHTVCVLTVRNADMPREMDGFCDAVGMLVERDLLGSPEVAVLERSRLTHVTEERRLSAEAQKQDLLGSLVLIAIDVSRDGRELHSTATLSDGLGRGVGAVMASANRDDAPGIATALADAVLKQLRTPLVTRPAPQAEAARFYREARVRAEHEDYQHAVAPAEAAYALAPQELLYAAMLARSLVLYGSNSYLANVFGHYPRNTTRPMAEDPSAVPAIVRGSNMFADIIRRAGAADPVAAGVAIEDLEVARRPLRDYILEATHRQIGDTESTPLPGEELAAAKAALRDFLLFRHAQSQEAVRDLKSFDAYSLNLYWLLSDNEWLYSRSPDEWTADMERLTSDWLKVRARFPNQYPMDVRIALKAIAWDWLLERHQSQGLYHSGQRRTRRWDPDEKGYARLNHIRQSLQDASDPVLKDYADFCALAIAIARSPGTPERVKPLIADFIARAENQIADPNRAGLSIDRQCLYEMIASADAMLDNTESAGELSAQVATFMLARHEIEPNVLSRAIYPIHNALRGWAKPRGDRAHNFEVLGKVVAVLDTPDRVVLSDWPDKSEQNYRRQFDELKNQIAGRNTAPPSTQPWGQTRRLFDVFDATTGTQWLFQPLVEKDQVLVLGIGPESPKGPLYAKLLRIPIAGGPPETVASVVTGLHMQRPPAEQRDQWIMSPNVPAACYADGIYCAVTARDGLIVLPADRRPARIVDKRSGLPSSDGQAVAVMGNKIYAGVGLPGKEAYFVCFDLTTNHCDTIASSLRKEHQSPFDDNAAFVIRGIVADPERERLLVAIEDQAPNDGLWEYKPASGRWKQLLPMTFKLAPTNRKDIGGFFQRVGLTRINHEKALVITETGDVVYDLATDRATKLFQRTLPNRTPVLATALPRYPAETDAGEAAMLKSERWVACNRALVGNWVWFADWASRPWGRTNLVDGRGESFNSLRNNGMPFSISYIAASPDDRTIIVGDNCGLWALPLTKPETGDGH